MFHCSRSRMTVRKPTELHPKRGRFVEKLGVLEVLDGRMITFEARSPGPKKIRLAAVFSDKDVWGDGMIRQNHHSKWHTALTLLSGGEFLLDYAPGEDGLIPQFEIFLGPGKNKIEVTFEVPHAISRGNAEPRSWTLLSFDPDNLEISKMEIAIVDQLGKNPKQDRSDGESCDSSDSEMEDYFGDSEPYLDDPAEDFVPIYARDGRLLFF